MAKANRKFRLSDNDEAVVGVGTLIVFIAMILVAAIAAAVIIKTAYSLKDEAERVGEAATNEATGGPKVLDILGDRGSPMLPSGAIQEVTFTITTWDGSQAINISNMRVHWIGEDTEVMLTYSTAGAGPNNYDADEIPDNTGGNGWEETNNQFWLDDDNVLYILIDLTSTTGIGDVLDPNEQVTVRFIPAHGPTVGEEFITPTDYGTARYVDLTNT